MPFHFSVLHTKVIQSPVGTLYSQIIKWVVGGALGSSRFLRSQITLALEVGSK